MSERRNLIVFFTASLASDAASQIQQVAIGWTVYSIHHRAFDLGLAGLVGFAPLLLFVFVAGHAIDRYDRKRIIIGAGILKAVTSLILAGLAFAGVDNLGIMLFVIFLVGVGRAFGSPAESTILVNMVGPLDYIRLQARYSAMREVAVVAGPALGGALVAISGVAAFAAAAAFMVVSVSAFALVYVRATLRGTGKKIDAGSALDGLRFIRSRPIVLGAISLDLFAVLFGGANALLPIYADQILHVGAFGFGMLRSASGIGASIMAVALRTARRTVASAGCCSSTSRASASR